MELLTRPARSGDLGELKSIWKTVFGDTDAFIDLFFLYTDTHDATVIEIGGEIAAMGYLLPVGNLYAPDGVRTPCAMIYSVAVLPKYRSRGLGAELTRALIASGHAAGFPAIVLHPASDSLFEFYAARTTMRDWFFASEYRGSIVPGNGKLTRLTVGEYYRLRGELLGNKAHIEFDDHALSFQHDICKLSGGGLFAVTSPGCADALATIELGETVAVKELLSLGAVQGTAAAIAQTFQAPEYTVRVLERVGSAGARFGMLAAMPDIGTPYNEAWYGLAFD